MAIRPTGMPPVTPMIDDEKLKAPMPATPPKPLVANTGPGSGGAPNVARRTVGGGIQPTGLPPRQPNADPTGGKEEAPPGFRQGIQKPNDPVVPRPVGGIPAGNAGGMPAGMPAPARRPMTPPGLAKRAVPPAAAPVARRPAPMPAARPRPVRAPAAPNQLRQRQRFDNGFTSQVTPGRWIMR